MGLKNWFRGKPSAQDIREELEAHIAMRSEHDQSDEAAARRRLGNRLQIQENVRAVWLSVWLDQLLQDLRYGVRTLRLNAGFTTVVVLTLAVAIGMNTAVFSIANAVLLRPLAYADPQRWLWIANYNSHFNDEIVSAPDYLDWRSQARSFEDLVAYGYQDSALAGAGEAARVRVVEISPSFWRLSGTRLAVGNFPEPQNDKALLISSKLFEQRFHGDPGVIRKTITLDLRPYTIAGVLAPDFRFLLPTAARGIEPKEADAYFPLVLNPSEADRSQASRIVSVVGKLKAGASVTEARAELEGIQARVKQQNPGLNDDGVQLLVTPLQEKLVGGFRRMIEILSAAAALVLLIACANIVSLLLARTTVRDREIAIRAAVGAGRMRVMRQFLAETILLAAGGGALGLLLAHWTIAAIARFNPYAIPRLGEASIDSFVLLFSVLICAGAAIVFALSPVLSFGKLDLHDALKAGGRTHTATSARLRTRGFLVAGQLALAMVLLAGAGLMVKSFLRMNSYPDGFVPEKTLLLTASLEGPTYDGERKQELEDTPARRNYVRELLQRLQSVPGIESAGITNSYLFGVVHVEGDAPPAPGQLPPPVAWNTASADYARAVGMQLLKGRWIRDSETEPVIAINEAFARRVFGDRDPLGKRIQSPGRTPDEKRFATVIGIVSDVKLSRLDQEPGPIAFVPYTQAPFLSFFTVTIRTAGDPASLAPAVRKLVSDLDPAVPAYDVKTLETALSDSIAPRRLNLFLLGTFAGAALLLAVIGIYGVIAYSVAQRTNEIGIRMALGARREEVAGMVVRQGMMIALGGIVAGVGAAYWFTRLMTSLLYDVKPNDPATFAAVTIALAAAALASCCLPALRAARIDPVTALRCE
jgi:putative ABC transport system permease protein